MTQFVKKHLDSLTPAQAKLATQVAIGAAVVVTCKSCLDVVNILRVGYKVGKGDARLPLKPRLSRKVRDEALKVGPKALEPFMGDKGRRPDAIIIGSGIGGLTCACLLGRAGKRVLVLEQHDLAGGCMHTYTAGGYEWDVGIHYVGEVDGPGIHKALLQQITRGQLEWKQQKDPYDVAWVPKNREEGLQGKWSKFPFGKGVGNNEKLLLERFPEEAAAIKAFYDDIRATMASGALLILPKILPKWLVRLVCPIVNVFTGFYTRCNKPLAQALDELGVKSDQLRATLAYPWGDLGNLPATMSYNLMLGLHSHFAAHGGFFPVGGAGAITHALVETVRAQGGEVTVRTPVAKILVEGNRAYGVRLGNGKEILVAKGGHIVSSATYQTLYEKLLAGQKVPEQMPMVTAPEGCMREGMATVSLFVGLENTSAELGIDKHEENAWCYRGPCFDKDFTEYLSKTKDEVVSGQVPLPGVFIGFPGSKDPAFNEDFPGKSTVTVITFVNWSWFAPFEKTRLHKRGDEYDALKDAVAKQMWNFVLDVYPQLKKAKIGHFEAGSPLSNNYYIGSNKGEIYGADHNFERYSLKNIIDARPDITGIKGLVVSGQDSVCGGFAGALLGGLLGAGSVLGSGAGVFGGIIYSGMRHVPEFSLAPPL